MLLQSLACHSGMLLLAHHSGMLLCDTQGCCCVVPEFSMSLTDVVV